MDNSVNKLVLKLSKSEKEFFSKHTKYSKKGDSNYLKLYNSILKNGSSTDIENDMKFEKNSSFKNISLDKEILLEKILISLINHKFENSFTWKIQRDIHYSQILIEKELFSKAQKIINRAKKIAYQTEEFELILLIISLEITLCFKHCFIENYQKFLELQNERNKIFEILNNIQQLLLIKTEYQQYQFNDYIDQTDLKNFEKIYGHSPFIPEENILSNRAKSIWLYNNFFYSYIIHDFNLAFHYHSKLYDLYKEYPKLFDRKEVLQLINNFLYSCSLIKNETLFNSLVNEFVSLKNQTKEETWYIKRSIFIRTLELYHQLKQFNKANTLALEAEDFLNVNTYFSSNFNIRYLQLLVIRAFVENNNFHSAIHISHRQFKVVGPDFSSSLFKIFEFIAHYKLKNFDNLLYSVNSWTKTIRSKRKQFPIEKVLIKFFHSVCNKATTEEQKKLILNIITQLKELEKSEQKYYINRYFDFAAWFERELEEMK